MVDTILNYFSHIGAINIGVLIVLSIYLIAVFWVFLYKYFSLKSIIKINNDELDNIIRNGKVNPLSELGHFIDKKNISKDLLDVYQNSIIKNESNGISLLSIVASTAPFVGLFGTVVGILESFAKFASLNKVGFNVIAPAISEALVATAAGIFVAVFAYAFHQILVRKLYILNVLLESQIKLILDRKDSV